MRDIVHGIQPAHQRGNGLFGETDDKLFAVAHAALDAARVIGLAVVALFFVVVNFVVDGAAAAHRRTEAQAELHALDRLHRHKRARKPAVQLLRRGHAAAEAALQAPDAQLSDAAAGVARILALVNDRHRPRLDILVHHVQLVKPAGELVEGVLLLVRHAARRADIADDLDPEFAQQLAADGARRDAHGGLARRRAL